MQLESFFFPSFQYTSYDAIYIDAIWGYSNFLLKQATDQQYEDCKMLLRLMGVPVIEVI